MIFNILAVLYLVGLIVGLWLLFKKGGEKPWKALVPVYNLWTWLHLCNKRAGWYVALFIPAINIFVILWLVIDTARCCRHGNFFEHLFGVVFPWIYLPIVGLSPKYQFIDPRVEPPAKVSEARDWLDAIVFAATT